MEEQAPDGSSLLGGCSWRIRAGWDRFKSEEGMDRRFENTDPILVFLFRQGIEEAGEELKRRFMSHIINWIKPYFLPDAEWQDVLAEALFGFSEAIRDYRFERNTPFSVFAKRCVIRQIQDAISKANHPSCQMVTQALRLETPLSDTMTDGIRLVLEDILSSPQSRPTTSGLHDKFCDVILRARLTKLERQVLICYLCGKSYREIAEELGIDTKSVDNTLQRIKYKTKEVSLNKPR